MSRFAKLFAANAIAAAGLCSAAVALSASAAAEPVVPPALPGVPALNMIQQFATNPAAMGAVLQTAATALNGAAGMVGAPAPNTLPVSPIDIAPTAPVGTLPAAPFPAAPYPAATYPAAPAAAPLPVAPGPAQTFGPLLNQLGVPGSLVGLAPNLPLLNPATALTPAAAPLPVTPVAPVAPVAPVGAIPLLNALP